MIAIAYLNGRFLPRQEAAISIDDGAFLHGAGVFETMRAEHRCVFRLEAHLGRLRRSAETLLMPIRPDQFPSPEVFRTLLERNELDAARIRLTITSGSVLAANVEQAQPTVCITASGHAGYPESLYRTGVSVVICEYRQSPADPLVGHKTTNYLPRLLALRQAQAKQCGEALWFTPQNLLAEGSISNVFVVQGGTVLTPPADTPVLPGVARAAVIELCRAASIPAEERPIHIHELLDADEVFLTNVAMQVMPVVCIERKDIRDGRPGSLTRRLLSDFRALVERECKDHG